METGALTEAQEASRPLRILLVDDDEDDYVLTRELLAEIPDARFELDWTTEFQRALQALLDCEHDLYLIDYRLGPTNGVELIQCARDQGCSSPMVLLTGLDVRQVDVDAMKAGAWDYLEKGKINAATLDRCIRYTLQQKRHADELERKVEERTAELARTNQRLEKEIAERTRVEEALRLEHRRKDEFLASLAHELRNPLVPVRFALEIMRIAGDRPEIVEKNRLVIERQTRHMVRLIDDLMDISRISRGKIQLEIHPVRLDRIIDEAVECVRPLIDSASHTLVIGKPADPVVFQGDAVRLVQVLLNLLNNASKFTDRCGRIEVDGGLEGDDVLIRVRDNGEGINPEEMGSLFNLFSQASVHPDRQQSGLGIGLSLARTLVELHGGTILAESAGLGHGSLFTVRLPRSGPAQAQPRS